MAKDSNHLPKIMNDIADQVPGNLFHRVMAGTPGDLDSLTDTRPRFDAIQLKDPVTGRTYVVTLFSHN